MLSEGALAAPGVLHAPAVDPPAPPAGDVASC